MKPRIKVLFSVLAAALLMASITGVTLTFLQGQGNGMPGRKNVQVELIDLAEDAENAQGTLLPGMTAEKGVLVSNVGDNPCYLRVKLCIPQYSRQDVLQAGRTEKGEFLSDTIYRDETEVPQEKNEYWLQSGEYISYKNRKTGDVLDSGKETPALYTSVRLNPSLRAEELPEGLQYDIVASVQAVPAGKDGNPAELWKKIAD